MGWLDPSALRIGLGCMRLPESGAADTIGSALGAGITIFDTARAYERNEALVAQSLRGTGARIVTKGGMSRPDGAWVPDGRAKAIRADCEASLSALDGHPVDLYLLHAPDPRTPFRTSLRALTRLLDEGLVRNIGVCNVNLRQLDEALDIAPISAVQIALSVFDDRALRGGVVARCAERGITLMAHSPLGGPRRAHTVSKREALTEIAAARGATPAEVALSWLLGLSDTVVPIPGARRPETAASAARAASIVLDADEMARVAGVRPAHRTTTSGATVVMVMGIPGAGKTRYAERFAHALRLNRDERGGTLRDLANALDAELAAGATPVVCDNTYLTRASRSHVIETAQRHGAAVRCVWLDTPLAQAQRNVVERLLDGATDVITPTSQMRTVREFEPPSAEEGFDEIERVPFVRDGTEGVAGLIVAAAAVTGPIDRDGPCLVFDWNEGGSDEALQRAASLLGGEVSMALCPHAGGPPRCWCRPPLPLLPMRFARAHGVDVSRSTIVGCRPAHRTLADTLGARYVDAS